MLAINLQSYLEKKKEKEKENLLSTDLQTLTGFCLKIPKAIEY